MELATFDDLFNQIFTEAYLIEQRTIKLLPKLIEKVHSAELHGLLEQHLMESKHQLARLEQALSQENIQTDKTSACPIDSIIESAEKCLKENEESHLLDAAVIAHMQQIEHVEIALYGTLKEYATQLNEPKIRSLISKTLKEESKSDTLLSKLAAGRFFKEGINVKAAK